MEILKPDRYNKEYNKADACPDARTNLSLQVVENVKDNLQQNIYKTIIPRNIRLAEAPSYGMPINLYDPKSAGADSYKRLADEVMNRE